MSSDFECFIEINNKNHRISLDNNKNGVSFADIYNKMQKTSGFEFICHKTHSFEIFYNEFGDYAPLLDENEVIQNFAHIRVLEKSFKSEPILTQSVLENCETNKNVNICDTKPIIYQTFNINENASIPSTSSTKYSDITININTSPNINSSQSSNSSDTKSHTLKISDLKQILKTDLSAYKIKSMKFMIKTIEKLKQNFIEKHLDFDNWVKVSNKMKKSGYKTFNSVKCKKDFYHFASIYRKVLEYCPNYATACDNFPLFKNFHKMDLSPFYVTSNMTFKNLCLLREKFELKEPSIVPKNEEKNIIKESYSVKNIIEVESDIINNEIDVSFIPKSNEQIQLKNLSKESNFVENDNEIEIISVIDSYRDIIKREEQSINGKNEESESVNNQTSSTPKKLKTIRDWLKREPTD